MKTQAILQVILIPLVSLALYSCGGNEQTTAAALAAMNVPEMVGDSTVKTALPKNQKEATGKEEKAQMEQDENNEENDDR